jgi:hypothetical protein
MNKNPTDEDSALIRTYIELTVCLDVLEVNRKRAEGLRYPKIFQLHFETMMDTVSAEMVIMRRNMARRGIRVLKEERDNSNGVFIVQYLCRGYTQEFRMLYGYLKASIEVKLASYLGLDINRIDRNR